MDFAGDDGWMMPQDYAMYLLSPPRVADAEGYEPGRAMRFLSSLCVHAVN